MIGSRLFLIGGGFISALISLLHVILAIKPGLYSVIAPSQASALSQMAVQGSRITSIVSIAIALVFAIWTIYAISGADLLRQLPLLRPALIAIGVIYILRSLFLPTEIRMVSNEGAPSRIAFYSILSFVAGLLYLIGVFTRRSSSPHS